MKPKEKPRMAGLKVWKCPSDAGSVAKDPGNKAGADLYQHIVIAIPIRLYPAIAAWRSVEPMCAVVVYIIRLAPVRTRQMLAAAPGMALLANMATIVVAIVVTRVIAIVVTVVVAFIPTILTMVGATIVVATMLIRRGRGKSGSRRQQKRSSSSG